MTMSVECCPCATQAGYAARTDYAVRLKACIGESEFPRWFGSGTLRRTI
jgi:hypothetical protein